MNNLSKHYLRPRWDFLGQTAQGILTIEGTSVNEIVKKYGSPVYVLVERSIRERFRQFKKAFPYPKLRVQYATKCNSNLEIMRIANQEGVEIDASSTGEVILALLADFEPNEISLTNLYKTEQDVIFAARVGVLSITADSLEDLELIESVGKRMHKKIDIFLRFNPIIDHGSYTSRKLQYGIPYAWHKKAVDYAVKAKFLNPIGIHFHGSYISSPKIYFLAAKKMFKIVEYALHTYNHKFKYIDLGGGFPVSTDDKDVFQPEDMGKQFSDFFLKQVNKLQMPLPTLIFEPGKFFVQNAGIGLTQVLSYKKTGRLRTIIMDSSTYAFLPDPLLAYGCEYEILPATKMNKRRQQDYRVSGSTCDCIDIIKNSAYLPTMERNDILAIMDCGAYSNTVASNFNSLKRAPMVMIKENGAHRLIRRRDRYSDMFAPELDVLKVAEPNELKSYYNLMRVNLDKLWGPEKAKKLQAKVKKKPVAVKKKDEPTLEISDILETPTSVTAA